MCCRARSGLRSCHDRSPDAGLSLFMPFLWVSEQTGTCRNPHYEFSSLQSLQAVKTSLLAKNLADPQADNTQVNPVTLSESFGNVKSVSSAMYIHDLIVRHQLDGDLFYQSKLIHMYGKCGDVKSAHHLFINNIECPSVFLWNVLIRGYAHLGQCQMALNLFNQMLSEGTHPDNFTMVCVITACSSHDSFFEGRQLHARTIASGLVTNHLVGNALLNMYSKFKSLECVKMIFVEMPVRNIVAWTTMIDACLQYGQNEDVFELHNRLQEEGECPDRIYFLTALSACADPSTLSQGKRTHVSVREMGLESDIFVRTALVNMYGKSGTLFSANLVFAEPYERNVALWNSIIAVYLQFGLDTEAFQHFHQMMQEGVLPDRVSFINSLPACANQGALEEAKRLHVFALIGVPTYDVMLGTSVIYMYGKCGSLEAACESFDLLCERTLVSWNVMLGVLTQHGEATKAFELFSQMQREGFMPDKYSFIHVLEACYGSEVLLDGELLHALIIDMGMESDVVVGTALVNMYNRCSGVEAAHRIFEKMRERNVVSWNTMIAVHVQRGKYRDAFQFFMQMHQEAMIPDNSTFISILEACVLVGEAMLVHLYIVENGFDLDISMGNALINMYGKFDSVEDALWVFQKLQARDLLSWTALLTAYVHDGRSEEALVMYKRMESDFSPGKATFLVVVEACANLAELVQGEQIFIVIVQKGLDLDAAVATVLVNLFGKAGSLQTARKVFDGVQGKDMILWTTMITVYSQNGLGKEAVSLFAEMLDEGLVPNNVTFVNILAGCSHTGLIDEGLYFLASMMSDYAMSSLVDHFDCIIDLFGRAGMLDEAERVIHRMPFFPRIVSYMALLGACRCQMDMERGERMAKSVFDLNSESSAPYVMFSNLTLSRIE